MTTSHPIVRAGMWIPVLVVVGLVGYCGSVMYLYVFPDIYAWSKGTGVVLMVVFGLIIVMLSWSYVATVFTHPGNPPPLFACSDPSSGPSPEVKKYLVERNAQGNYRWCNSCKVWKPDRAHHCSTCNECILKMDHHCPWVNTCVGWKNYKFFLLFLYYTTAGCLVTAVLTVGQVFAKGADSTHVLVAFIIALSFLLAVGGMGLMHTTMVFANEATLESWGGDGSPFRLATRRANIESVCGRSVLCWPCPVPPALPTNGYAWKRRGQRNVGRDSSGSEADIV